MIERSKLLVERGVLTAKLAWAFKEEFRYHREEFRRILRAILINQRWFAAVACAAQRFVLSAHHSRPRPILSGFQERRAVDRVVFEVKLMGELVEHDVIAIVDCAPAT